MKKNKNIIFFIIPCFIFGIFLLAFYPGVITSDGSGQWQQVISDNISNAHPFFSTYFMALLSKLWNKKTIVIIYQILLFSFIWYRICNQFLKQYKEFKKITIYTIITCLVPIIAIYAITLWKDIIYSYYLLAIIYYIYKGIINKFNHSKTDASIIGLLLFGIFSYRHNGMIVASLLILVFSYIYFKHMKKINILIMLTSFILLNIAVYFPKNYYLEINNRENTYTNIGSLDGFYMWMIGAHLQHDYIEKKDLETLNNIIELDEYKKSYTGFLINAISMNPNINKEYLNDNTDKVSRIFFKYTFKHPLTIIVHYAKADALLWSPFPVGYVYHFDYKEWYPNFQLTEDKDSKLPFLNTVYEKVTHLTIRKPLVWLYRPALIMYITLILLFLIVKALKNKSYYLLSLPMLFNILSLALINPAQDLRYVYINYLTFTFVFLLFILNFKKILKMYKKNKLKGV